MKITQVEEIVCAVAHIVGSQKQPIFSREDIRRTAKIERNAWNNSYSPTFQAMRSDHPGGAPLINSQYRNIFRQVSHGQHTLTEYGYQLLKESGLWQLAIDNVSQEAFIPEVIGPHQMVPGDNFQPSQEMRTGTVIYFVRIAPHQILMKPVPHEDIAIFDKPKYRLHIDQKTGGLSFEQLL